MDQNLKRPLTPSKIRSIHCSILGTKSHLSKVLKTSRNPPSRPRLCWLVENVHEDLQWYLQDFGTNVMIFNAQTEWNFQDDQHQRAFIEYMDYDEPDEIWISPQLENESTVNDMNLQFKTRIFNKQAKAGRFAHLIQPRTGKAWNTNALDTLMATYSVDIDQCTFNENQFENCEHETHEAHDK